MEFDTLLKSGYRALEDIIDQQTEENHKLEFKTKKNPKSVELHKEDRRNLGEALSGFANATGGLLIIGVRTQTINGIDKAHEIQEIDNIKAVTDRYRAYAFECVSPPIDQVRVDHIATSSSTGVLLIDVPQGNARPHMSTAPSHQRYYRRGPDAFFPMQHYEIEEMIQLKSKPVLDLALQFRSGGILGGNPKLHILFGLKNISDVMAKFPFISYEQGPAIPKIDEFGIDDNGGTLWKRVISGDSQQPVFAGGVDMVIHPEQELYISKISMVRDLDERFQKYWPIESLADSDLLNLKFEWGCEDMPKRMRTKQFTKSQLLYQANSIA